MARSQGKMTVSETLKQAIVASGLTARELGRRSGVTHSSITRFVNGERGLRHSVVDALAEALGLQLEKRTRRCRRA
ncbi:unnamed protein product [marine sediment metagenome]|uniref:HTH cro/C1-type domain-containing protein n=1 Tax=marine sediment metagenome TaxID=412755 RepID=X0UDS8_9ZZZZ